ncbi:MAG: MT-A70 family methyltransferase [Rhodobacteraceae bacterium]|nr:MT-A70 family methyltransferase [Paracoccaceae bacterium]
MSRKTAWEPLFPRQLSALKTGAANRIRMNLADGVRKFIAVGEDLLSIKKVTRHGDWEKWVDEKLPLSRRSAEIFMRIARDPNILRLAKANHDSHLLPADKAILNELCGMTGQQFDGLVEAGVIHADMKRGDARCAVRRSGAPAAPALPEPHGAGGYGVILADPPWPWESRGAGGKGRSAEMHYPVMTVDAIAALPVGGLAGQDCVLFLWAVSSTLPQALAVMEAWGFEYRTTGFVWVKDGPPGLGYWTRKGAELCLLGVKGRPARLNADVSEVVSAPRYRHSEKPVEIRKRIMRLAAGPYIELFARQAAAGWDAWGNEAPERARGAAA